MQKILTFLAAAVIGVFVTAHAYAQNTVSIGTLTCSGGQGVGLILGSEKTFNCTFSPSNAGAPQSYRATLTKIGLDVGVTGNTVMVWTVLASTATVSPKMLTGTYSGVSADVAVAWGGGAKILVGGSAKSIALQPVSVQGQTGVNIAVGVASMTLR